jgi:hypothetical protein
MTHQNNVMVFIYYLLVIYLLFIYLFICSLFGDAISSSDYTVLLFNLAARES